MEDKYCSTCGVRWNPFGGYYHKPYCSQWNKQGDDCDYLTSKDYTLPESDEYLRGWNDAIKKVIDVINEKFN